MTRKSVLVMLVAVVLSGFGLLAQGKLNDEPNSRSVQGIVTDAAGKPLQGAVVQLKDTKTLQIRSFITEADGSYHFAGLSPNIDYELRAQHNGQTSGTKTLSHFDSKNVTIVNLKLK